ncbi:MAG TPA: antibiotic biosynthesis monooxygenase [Actinomycetes bacterium]|nr:antibiotic biosynthesis monooxygenase [Actinomycetes bacterium]
MWAQLMKMRTRPEKLQDLPSMFDELQAAEQPGSGLVRSVAMQDQQDPNQIYVLVMFESEEQARAREQDPRRKALLESVQAQMSEVFEGPPEFVDLTVIRDVAQ